MKELLDTGPVPGGPAPPRLHPRGRGRDRRTARWWKYVPLYRGQDNEVITQYAMKDVEKIGLIKFDFLGLKTLTVIEDVSGGSRPHRGERLGLRRADPARRPDDLRAPLRRGHRRGLPAGKLGDEGPADPAQAGALRGHHRPRGPLPPGPAGERHGGRLHQAQARQEGHRLRPAPSSSRS